MATDASTQVVILHLLDRIRMGHKMNCSLPVATAIMPVTCVDVAAPQRGPA
jgi:hypothetical protein